MRDLIQQGVERMRKRRKADVKVARLAARDPENIAKGLILLAQREHDRLQRGLREQFGFSVTRGEAGGRLPLKFDRPERLPRTRETAALWTDAVVRMLSYGEAVRVMHHAQAYFPERDRARKVCAAFADAMREAPGALYGGLWHAPGMEPAVTEYAAAMLAAWTRGHLRADVNPELRKVLTADGWENELINAVRLAWAERDPGLPLKHPTRFRDSVPPKKAGGRRRRWDAPPDLVNLTSAALQGKDITTKKELDEPMEIALAGFSERELEKVREAALEKGRRAGLPPREMELYEFFVRHEKATKRQAADHFGITVNTVKKLKKRIKKTLNVA